MTDTDVAACTRRCAATGRELQPGEKYVAALTEAGGTLARADYAADAWPGPPPNAVAYWSGKVPPAGRPRKPSFPEEHLAGLFAQLAGSADPGRANLRYAVALLLMRRKRLKFEDVTKTPDGDVLVLRDARTGTRHRVPDPRLTDAEVATVQDEIVRQLGWE